MTIKSNQSSLDTLFLYPTKITKKLPYLSRIKTNVLAYPNRAEQLKPRNVRYE